MHNLTIDIIWHLQRSIKWHPCVLFRLLTSQHPLDFRTVAELTAWHGVKSEITSISNRCPCWNRIPNPILNTLSFHFIEYGINGNVLLNQFRTYKIISLLYRSWIGKRYKTQTLFVPNHTAPKNSLHLTNWSLYVH